MAAIQFGSFLDSSIVGLAGPDVPEIGSRGGERAIRWTTIGCVVVLAVIAAVVSYRHRFVLVRRYGETSWTAALMPVSVDGMIAASSMSLLLDVTAVGLALRPA